MHLHVYATHIYIGKCNVRLGLIETFIYPVYTCMMQLIYTKMLYCNFPCLYRPNTSPADFTGREWVVYWAQAIGSPFCILAFILHAIIITIEKLRTSKLVKVLWSIIVSSRRYACL